MRDVGTGPISAQAAAEAARRAEAARQAEMARQQAEAARQAKAAADKAKALEAAVKAEHQGDKSRVDGTGQLDEARARMGHMNEATPWEAAASAKKAEFPVISADDLKHEPALGKQLAEMAKDADPDVQAYVKETVTTALKDDLRKNLKEHPGEASLDAFKADVSAMASKTGLGDVMKEVSAAALEGAATDLLNEGVSADDLAKNPSLGKVIATLQTSTDAAVREKLDATVRGWTDAALTAAMDGKSGEGDVKDGIKEFQDKLRDIATRTGLGESLTKAADASMKDQKGHIEDLADKGKPLWKKGLDLVGDVFGKVLDFGGDLVKDVAHVTSETIAHVTDVVAEGVQEGADLAGDLVDTGLDAVGKGTELASGVAGAGLDAVGAHGAADNVRHAGHEANAFADKAGDVANTVIDKTGAIDSKILSAVGHGAASLTDKAGGAIDTIADGAGALAADGPMGAAAKLADGAIGPEKAEYMGQIDGFTGIVANRLGKGDAVFLRMEVGAEVGLGASAGASVNGQGASSNNEAFVGAKLSGGALMSRTSDGKIALQLDMGAGVEAGVKSESQAGLGVGAELEARASAAAEGRGKITMEFDPNNPDDVKRLKALTEPTPAKVIAAAGNPLAAAAITGPALADAIRHNEVSREIGGSVGAKASASASAGLGPVAAELGVGASAVLGGSQKFNKDGTTDTTLYVRAGASASAKAGAGPASAEGVAGANAVMSVTVKKDASGNIIGISGEEGGNAGVSSKVGAKGSKAGADSAVQRKSGSVGANHTETDTTVTSLTPEGLAEARRRLGAGESILGVYHALDDAPGMHTDTTFSTETSSATVGIKADVSLGVHVGINAQATVGKSHTDISDPDRDPSSVHRELTNVIAASQGRN